MGKGPIGRGVIMASLAVLLLAGTAGAFFNELNRTAIFESTGFITAGERFGVKIGIDRGVANRRIGGLSGMQLHKSFKGGICLMRSYDVDVTVDLYIDNSWRHGSICIASQRGVVTELAWMFGSP